MIMIRQISDTLSRVFSVRLLGAFAVLCLFSVLGGCIKNDLPYPKIPQYILTLAVEDEACAASLDSVSFKATVYLDETADIRNVRFSEYSFTSGATSDPDLLDGTYDLSTPIVVTLSRYQTYQWIVEAEQHISRVFEIKGQIGETSFDEVGRRVVVKIPSTENLAHLTLTDIKLGPAGITTLTPAITPGAIDLSKPLVVTVSWHDHSEDWTIYAEKSDLLVSTSQVDAWSEVIWAYGEGPADLKGGFRYRLPDSEEWTEVPESEITQTAGAFSACIAHLQPLTTYEVRAYAGENEGNIVTVTTQTAEILPDADFNEWWLKDKKIWCPWAENGTRFWDTGNTGAATLGQSNVQPSDHLPPGVTTGQSAKLETRFVGIAGIGKLAAGSIYTGEFVKVDGTNGILAFGRPWTVRPTSLSGYFDYTTAPINYASAEYEYLKGRPDSCHIYVALTDWAAPYEIRTNPKNRQLFDPTSPEIIGYGELVVGETTGGYREFKIDIKYNSTARVPRYIQITCAASKYGDFFTGGAGATLYVDQLSLGYDR